MEHEKQSQVVQTAWATMALIYADYPYPEPIERAVRLVMSRQLPVSPLHSSSMRRNADVLLGRLVATRIPRRHLQQNRYDRLPALQVLLHNLDARQGTPPSGEIAVTKSSEEWTREREFAFVLNSLKGRHLAWTREDVDYVCSARLFSWKASSIGGRTLHFASCIVACIFRMYVEHLSDLIILALETVDSFALV